MLLRKPLPVWISVSLFGVAVTMIPLSGQMRRPPVSSPGTMTELSARLARCIPSLHVVPQLPDHPESSVWVCARPQSREQLWGLMRSPHRVKTGQWQGIVFCERAGDAWVIDAEDEFIHTVWGEYGMRIGRFVLFGDPDLLQRIRAVILDGEAAGKKSEIISQ